MSVYLVNVFLLGISFLVNTIYFVLCIFVWCIFVLCIFKLPLEFRRIILAKDNRFAAFYYTRKDRMTSFTRVF